MQEEKRERPWLRGLVVALATLALAVPATYMFVQVYLAVRRAYRTETAIAYTMADSIALPGVAMFEKTAAPGEGNLGYLVADGERVTAGTALAECYTREDQGVLRERLDRVQDTLTLLNRSQNAAGAELSQLTSQGQQALYTLLDRLDVGAYANAREAGDEFLLAQNRLQVRTGQSGGFEQAIAGLQQEEQALEGELSALQTVTAQTNGYFLSAPSAAGLEWDKAKLDAMSAADLQAGLSEGAPRAAVQGAGEIVTGFSWWFYAACTAEQAARFDGVSQVNISVPGKQEEPLTATVLSLEQDEGGEWYKLVLECQSINAEVLRFGQENARIDLHTYTGLRIDRRAMHISEGRRGVYVKYGSIQRFLTITVLYENENYLLVPFDEGADGNNEVRLYDEIIVEGNNLGDNKLL